MPRRVKEWLAFVRRAVTVLAKKTEPSMVADLTGLTREEMMFDKEKLLSVFDQTVAAGTDPIRTSTGKLGAASELPGQSH